MLFWLACTGPPSTSTDAPPLMGDTGPMDLDCAQAETAIGPLVVRDGADCTTPWIVQGDLTLGGSWTREQACICEVTGSVNLEPDTDSLLGLSQVTSIGGLLGGQDLPLVTSGEGLERLETVGSGVSLGGLDTLESLSLPAATELNSLHLNSAPVLTSLELPALTRIPSGLGLIATPGVDALHAPNLAELGGLMLSGPSLDDLTALSQITEAPIGLWIGEAELSTLTGLDQVVEVGALLLRQEQALDVSGLAALESAEEIVIDAPVDTSQLASLRTVSELLASNSGLHMPSLQTVGELVLTYSEVTGVDLPELTTVGRLDLTGHPAPMSLPKLTSVVEADLYATACPNAPDVPLTQLETLTLYAPTGCDLLPELTWADEVDVRAATLGSLRSVATLTVHEADLPALVEVTNLLTLSGETTLPVEVAATVIIESGARAQLGQLVEVSDDIAMRGMTLELAPDAAQAGSLKLQGTSTLLQISGLVSTGGDVELESTGVRDLDLGELTTIGRDLRVVDNEDLDGLGGLESLVEVGGDVQIEANPGVTQAECDALEQRLTVGGSWTCDGS